jgi:hypothetical protein
MAGEMAEDLVRAPGPSGGRKFGISDAMILTAGAALALSASTDLMVLLVDMMGRLGREVSAHAGDLPTRPSTFWEVVRHPLRNTVWYGSQVGFAVMVGFTPAWLIVRLRRPRASMGDLLRQPGAVAALAMVFGLFWGTGALVTWFPGRFDGMSAAPSAIGGAVAIAWGGLALSRRWRSEPGWIDRVGRLLGCLAIGLAVLHPLIFRI